MAERKTRRRGGGLGDVIGDGLSAVPTPAPKQPEPAPELTEPVPTKSVSPKAPKSVTPIRTKQEEAEEEGTHYDRDFHRKECRFTDAQLDGLAVHARRLNRSRNDRTTNRITENTLVRIAVNALLDVADKLDGDTEEELEASFRNKLRK